MLLLNDTPMKLTVSHSARTKGEMLIYSLKLCKEASTKWGVCWSGRELAFLYLLNLIVFRLPSGSVTTQLRPTGLQWFVFPNTSQGMHFPKKLYSNATYMGVYAKDSNNTTYGCICKSGGRNIWSAFCLPREWNINRGAVSELRKWFSNICLP